MENANAAFTSAFVPTQQIEEIDLFFSHPKKAPVRRYEKMTFVDF